jgi:acetyltransferase-like isoleucine patch superfamily enzyme
MAFLPVDGQIKYYKLNECTKGQKLVDNGEYVGVVQGKFGDQFKFRQKDGQIVVIGGRDLAVKLENHAPEGTFCNVYYDEKIVLTSGAMKGKDCHKFKLEIDPDTLPKRADKKPTTKMNDTDPDISL